MSPPTPSRKGTKPAAPAAKFSAAAAEKKASPAAAVNLTAHALAPDLETIGRFIRDLIARGAIAELVASVLGLLQRMREINTELMARIAVKSRKRPPSETAGVWPRVRRPTGLAAAARLNVELDEAEPGACYGGSGSQLLVAARM